MTQPSTLHRLIYCSRQLAETRDWDDHVETVLAVSIRNNRRDGLTGLLLCHGGWFVQALEGPASAVSATYGRILVDPRHHSPQVLVSSPATERAFPQWSMCARRLSPLNAAVIGLLRAGAPFDPRGLDGDDALALLSAVGDLQVAVAA